MSRRRIRKHANPFQVQTRIGIIDRNTVFGREAPLEIELGCGSSEFLFARARANPDRDFIGLEVRLPLVELALQNAERPKNAWVYYANANENLELAEPGTIRGFHIHFPDPCFKKRHFKRRIVQPHTVRKMTTLLAIGGFVYAQTDVWLLAEEMYCFFSSDGALGPRLDPSMIAPRPFPERTPWERQHEAENEPIYRMLFEKVREPQGPVPQIALRHTDPSKIKIAS